MANNDIDFNALMEELGLINDGDAEIDTSNLPKERSAVPKELPQPGTLRLRLPEVLNGDAVKAVQVTGLGNRMQLQLRDEFALQDSKSGLPINYNVSAAEMAVFENGQVVGYKSEFAYLAKACGWEGSLSSKADQLRAVYSLAGKEVKADASWTATCNPKRQIYRDKAKQDIMGCGQKYKLVPESYVKKDGTKVNIFAIPRDAEGKYMQRFTCQNSECRAELQAFLSLGNYRKV